MSKELFAFGRSLPEAYHDALNELRKSGEQTPCPDWNCTQLEASMTMVVLEPLAEPRISRLFPGGPEELQQYKMEMLDGILDFEIQKGNWEYTYHDRIVNYSIDNQIRFPNQPTINQISFIIDELKRNPYSRRAVIDIRDNSDDMYSNDPACLQHIQYFIRNGKLDCKVLFRSNDACKATYMNAFALICIQERLAQKLGVEVGTYTHRANSFHCYEKDYGLLDGYVSRIESGKDLTYYYEDDWKDDMEDYISDIFDKVADLKKR